MIRRVITDRPSWALLALCLALAGFGGVQWQRGAPAPLPPPPTASVEAGEHEADVTPLRFPPLSAYQEVVERPLFRPDRRPPPAPERGASGRVAGPPPAYELEGTVVSAAGRFVILKEVRNQQQRHRLEQGEDLDGWTVAEVGEGWARLAQGERDVRLALDLPGETNNESGPALSARSGGQLRGPILPR